MIALLPVMNIYIGAFIQSYLFNYVFYILNGFGACGYAKPIFFFREREKCAPFFLISDHHSNAHVSFTSGNAEIQPRDFRVLKY